MHAVRMRHRIGFFAKIHDRVCNAARYIDEREITELSVGPVQSRRKLSRKLEHDPWVFGCDLAEARVSHFGDFAFGPGANPSATGRLFVKQAHLTEELAFIEIGKDHLIAVFVFNHDFDRAVHDVIEHVG